MRDVDRGLPGPSLEVEDPVLELVAEAPVQRGQRLVEVSTLGFVGSTRASATRCCWGRPTAGPEGGRHSRPDRPMRASPSDASADGVLAGALDREPEADVVRDRQGAGTRPASGTRTRCSARAEGRYVTSSSSKWIRPAVGSTRPASIRSVVVLPQPDGPSRVSSSPSAMSLIRFFPRSPRHSAW